MGRWKVETDIERFEKKYEPVTECGCWLWTGATNSNRYGSFYFPDYPIKVAKSMVKAHRASLYLYKGILPSEDQVVLHSCDNGFCCNPDHLSVGTQVENMADMSTKRRSVTKTQVLTDEDVDLAISLREEGLQIKDTATMFGMSISQMSRVTRKLTHQYAL